MDNTPTKPDLHFPCRHWPKPDCRFAIMIVLGIDTGGTFTDFVLLRQNRLSVHKVLSTPAAPDQAILQGIADMGLNQALDDDLLIVHGSTVATNAVLEGKGVRTAFITNHGMGDMLTIARQVRSELYNLQPQLVEPPVQKELCLETGGRLGADGSLIEPLTDSDLAQLEYELKLLSPDAVAINLLFSFLDETLEKRIASIVPKHMFVSRSSEVLPECREYERGITTWLNASVGPLVKKYLDRLNQGLERNIGKHNVRLAIMQSSGGTIDSQQAAKMAVNMLLSGPAGGMAGAKYVAASSGRHRLLTFDMGGTSTDVAMIDGDLQLTSEGRIGRYPVSVPMVDMHTIGAGGGSIASVDAGGVLQVGPESAGASPGPACYGNGATQPTVTDANLVLGRLRPDAFLGGKMQLSPDAAHQAIEPLAAQLDISIEETAQGIVQVANEHMARALRVMSVERGIDPAELTLVSFGGAGGLHVCALAEALGMRHAMVPIHAGVLSAFGMLVAPRMRNLSRSFPGLLAKVRLRELMDVFSELSEQGLASLQNENVSPEQVKTSKQLDLRYLGQSYTLTVDWQDIETTQRAFHKQHEARYGHRLDLAVELVTVRVSLQAESVTINLSGMDKQAKLMADSMPASDVKLFGINVPVAVYQRDKLKTGASITGPALITETVATTYISPGWTCRKDHNGTLLLEKGVH